MKGSKEHEQAPHSVHSTRDASRPPKTRSANEVEVDGCGGGGGRGRADG